jgi:hypothetical protein
MQSVHGRRRRRGTLNKIDDLKKDWLDPLDRLLEALQPLQELQHREARDRVPLSLIKVLAEDTMSKVIAQVANSVETHGAKVPPAQRAHMSTIKHALLELSEYTSSPHELFAENVEAFLCASSNDLLQNLLGASVACAGSAKDKERASSALVDRITGSVCDEVYDPTTRPYLHAFCCAALDREIVLRWDETATSGNQIIVYVCNAAGEVPSSTVVVGLLQAVASLYFQDHWMPSRPVRASEATPIRVQVASAPKAVPAKLRLRVVADLGATNIVLEAHESTRKVISDCAWNGPQKGQFWDSSVNDLGIHLTDLDLEELLEPP